MFRRRNRRPINDRLREVVWPSLGWRRWVDYFRHRVGRMPGTPYAIACGFAFGAAISFTPFMGLHIFLAAFFAYLARASILASAIGTVVGNPWTFPFIWVGIFKLGNLILGANAESLKTQSLSLDYLMAHPWDVFLPMSVGGVAVFGFVWAGFFFPMRRAVAGYQQRRLRRRMRKQARAAAAERAGNGITENSQ